MECFLMDWCKNRSFHLSHKFHVHTQQRNTNKKDKLFLISFIQNVENLYTVCHFVLILNFITFCHSHFMFQSETANYATFYHDWIYYCSLQSEKRNENNVFYEQKFIFLFGWIACIDVKLLSAVVFAWARITPNEY